MKIMILSLLMAVGYYTSTEVSSTGETQIIEYVAGVYEVAQSEVTLTSPNLVNVSLSATTSTQGLASFKPCGTDCTKVKIEFPSATLNFIIEEEVQGL